MDLATYLDVTLTKAHYRIGRALQSDMGEVGQFGYWLAFFQFIGFLVGGVAVYFYLQNERVCDECKKYLRKVSKKGDSFADAESFSHYFDNVYVNPVDSKEFAQHISADYSAGKAQKGTINLTTSVLECPGCYEQSVLETIQIYNGQDWKDVGQMTRWVKMPKDFDVRRLVTSAK